MNKKNVGIAIAGILLFTFVLTMSFSRFSNKVFDATSLTAGKRLAENTKANVKSIKTMIDKDVAFLRSTADRLATLDSIHSKEAQEIITSLSRHTEFIRIGVDSIDGTSVTSDGYTVNVNDMGYIDKISENSSYLTDMITAKVDNNRSTAIMVPIRVNRRIVGAVRGVYEDNKLMEALDLSAFDESGCLNLVDSKGNFVHQGNVEEGFDESENFYEEIKSCKFTYNYTYEKMMSDISNKISGFTVYEIEGVTMCAYYTPVENWYLISVMPISSILKEKNIIDNAEKEVITVLTLTFLAILIGVMLYARSTRKNIATQKIFFESILNSIPIPVFIASMTKKLEYVNNAALDMYDKPRNELIGGPCNQLGTSICDTEYCSIEQLLNNGNTQSYVTINDKSYQVTSALLDIENTQYSKYIEVVQDITELMRVQATLEEKSTELETVSESIAGGLVVTKLIDDFEVIRCNQGFYDMTGRTYSEIFGHSVLEYIPQNEMAMVFDNILTQLSSGDTAKLEHRLLTKKGKTVWVSTQGRRANLGGQEVGIWMFTDISDVKEAEEKLRISEELYRVATSNTEDVIVDFDIVNRRFVHTENVIEKYGVPIVVDDAPDKIIEMGVIEGQNGKEFIEMVQKIYAGEEKVSCTIRVKAKKGYVWVKIFFTTAFDDLGKPVRAIGIIQDISKEYEERSKYEREARYRGAVTQDAILSYEANLTGRIFTQGHEKLSIEYLGEVEYEYDKVISVIVDKMAYPDDKAKVLKSIGADNLLDNFYNGNSRIKFEYRRLTKNGDYGWVECVVYMLEEAEVEGVYAVYYIRDIDNQKKHELQLLQKAEIDLLTGVYNKITTENLVKKYIEENPNSTGAFLIVDLDNFKNINDSLGHAFGDAVLSEVATNLSNIFRESDIVGRIGGDEFVVFIKNAGTEERIKAKAQAICEMFRDSYTGSTNNYKVSGTVGIAIYPEHGLEFDVLYRRADTALYYAKRRGKDNYNMFVNGIEELSAVTTTEKDTEVILGKEFAKNISEYVLRILYESNDYKLAISSILELISKHYRYSRGYILEMSSDKACWQNTYEWCDKGITPQMENLQAVPYDMYDAWNDSLSAGKMLNIGDVSKISDSGFRRFNEQQNVRSAAVCAIVSNGEIQGYVGFDDCINIREDISQEETDVLRLVSVLVGTYAVINNEQSNKNMSTEGIEEVMNSIDNFVYIVDTEDYTIKFVNNATLKLLPNIKVGDICHLAMRENEELCDDCPIRILKEQGRNKHRDKIINTKYDLHLDVTVSNIKWCSDNKNYCLVHSMEIPPEKREK